MNSLNIDFRDGHLRILIVEGGAVRYSKMVTDFPVDDVESSRERLASEIKQAGWKRGRVNVILPSHTVKYATYHTPSVKIEDAEKIVGREISRETKGQRFTFGIRRIVSRKKADAAGQDILAEYVLRADAALYLDLLKSCGIRPHGMTSSLDGNVHCFNRYRPQTDGNEALLDIGVNVIEIAVFNNGRLMEYEKKSLSRGDDKHGESDTSASEQTDKIRTYRIVDLLYNFLVSSRSDSPEQKLATAWICGVGSLTEGIADSISEGLGVNCRVIDLGDTMGEKASAFTALSGVALLSKKERSINLIPEDILDERTRLFRRLLLAASLSLYVFLLVYGYAVLNRTESSLRTTYEKAQSDRLSRINISRTDDLYSSGQTGYAKIVSRSRGFYGVFRDIANLTPPGVALERIEVQNVQDVPHLKIAARIHYDDENFRNALLSKFLMALDGSGRLKRISAPDISLSQSAAKEKEVTIKALYEVIR
jgi:hypothetical protein